MVALRIAAQSSAAAGTALRHKPIMPTQTIVFEPMKHSLAKDDGSMPAPLHPARNAPYDVPKRTEWKCPMHGLMQDWPLLTHKILDHAATYHGAREVVSRTIEGPLHRTTYDEIHSRARRVAKALQHHGIASVDRVATMAWNTYRHVEAWYGIM